MNRIYKTLWSVATQSWQAVPENARTGGKKSTSSTTGVVASVALSWVLTSGAHAQSPPAINQLPTNGVVARGTATINQTATAQAAAMTVNQSSQRAVINWDTFNLGSKASVNFVQPNAQAVTLNRVNDSNPSQIFGRMTANGQVFLSNANGVYFSPTSSVDVGAITATTHNISDDNFMSGNYVFERNGATGKVVNEGNITAALGGYVALLAPEVQNAGVVVARAGTVALAAGEMITLNVDSNGSLAGITTTPSAIASLVENKLAVLAPDGQIILSAVGLNKLQVGLIKNSGSLEANSLVSKGGKIYLEGDDITLSSTSRLEAKGPTGGGTVLVGGDWQGSGTLHQATKVTMEAGATIDASGTDNGDGGKVVLWSDVKNANSVTQANGNIKAEAGPNGGDGGKVETSGHNLNVDGIQVSTQSTQGNTGEWLLDPNSITISTSADSLTSNSSNTFTSSSANGVINVSTLNTALSSNNVTVDATTAGGGPGNIYVNSTALNQLTWSTNKTLTLSAAGVVSGAGYINMTGGGSLTINQAGTNIATPLSATIAGNGSLTKNGAGTLMLSGNSNYSGGTTINQGIVMLGSTTALGSGPVHVNNTATLDLNGQTMASTTGALTLNSTGSDGGALTAALTNSNIASPGTYPGLVTLASDTTIKGASGGSINLTNAGTITGAFNLTLDGTTGGRIDSVIGTSTGTLTKLGTGSWTLTGNNTYSGTTTISAGTLNLGLGTSSGTFGTGSVTNNSELKFWRSDAFTVSNDIRGTGSVTQVTGSTILTGANTYSGTTTINTGGTLQIGDGHATGTLGSAAVTNNGTLIFNRSDAITVSNNISGTGSVTQAGSGTTTLTGANSYVATTISGGTLQIGDGGSSGSLGTGTVTNNAALVFNRSDDISVGNAISGTGSVQKLGSNTLTFSNASNGESFSGGTTISGGTLKVDPQTVGIAFINSGKTINVSQGAMLYLAGTAGTLSSTISGAGGITVDVSGSNNYITLSGPSTYTGPTYLKSGGIRTGVASVANAGGVFISGPLGVNSALTIENLANTSVILQNDTQIGSLSGGGSLGGNFALYGHNLTVGGDNTNTTFSGVILDYGSGGTFKKVGTGTLTLTGTNTYIGLTDITAGTLRAASNAALGATSGGVNVASGATLEIGGTTAPGNVAIGAEALTIASGGTVHNVAGANTYAGAMTLTAPTAPAQGTYTITIDTGTSLNFTATTGTVVPANSQLNLNLTNGNLTLARALSGTAGSSSYVKAGTGTLTMPAPTNVTAKIGLYARLLDPTGTDYSTVYGSVPDYTYGLFDAASGGSQITSGFTTSGTPTWSGTAPVQGSAAGAYSLTYASGLSVTSSTYGLIGAGSATAWTVTPKTVTFTLTAPSSTYNGVTTYANIANATTFTTSALYGGDSVTAITKTPSTAGVAQAGNFTITPSAAVLSAGASAGNYSFDYASSVLTATVAKANLTLSGARAYNGTTITAGNLFTATGVNGEAFAVTGTGAIGNLSTANFQTNATLASVAGLAIGASNGTTTGDPNNYNLSTAGSSFSVSRATATLTANKTYSGDTSLTGSQLAITGVTVNGTTETLGYTGTASLFDPNVATANNYVAAGTGLALTNGTGLASNYVLPAYSYSANNSATVNRATATVTASKTYNGDTSLAAGQVSITGVTVGGVTQVLDFTGTATLSDPHVATANKYVDTSLMMLADGSSGLASNYNLPASAYSATRNTATINRLALTVTPGTDISAASTAYGDTQTPGAVSFANKVTGDDVNAVVSVTVPAGATSGAGMAKVGNYYQSAGTSLTGAQASDYSFTGVTSSTANYTITQRALTGTSVAAGTSVYGSSFAPGAVTFGNVLAHDDVSTTATVNTSTLSPSGNAVVGSYTQTTSTVLAGADAANYNLAAPVTSGSNYTISQKALTLNIPGATRVYDGSTSIHYTGAATVNGAFSADDVQLSAGSVTGFVDKNVGTNKAVTYTGFALTGNDASNYVLPANPASSANITAKTLTVTGLSSSASRVYDGTTNATVSGAPALQTAEVVGAGSSADGKPYSGDVIGLTGTATGTYNSKDVATANTVSFGGLASNNNNYVLDLGTQAATITAKTLTVSGLSAAASRVYDASLTAVATGTPTLLTAQAAGAGNSTDGTPYAGDVIGFTGTATGTYNSKDVATANTVTFGGLASNNINYNLSFGTQAATITRADLALTGVSAQNKTYDTTTAAQLSGTASVSPLGSDVVTLNTGAASALFADKTAGTHKPVTATGYTISGTDANNYNLLQPTGLTADINKADLVVTGITAANKVYDATRDATLSGAASVSGLAGDVVIVTGTGAGLFVDKNAGVGKSVSVSGYSLTGADANNYNVVQPTGVTADISKASLTVTAVNTTRNFGAANPAFNVTISGYVGGETAATSGVTGTGSGISTATTTTDPGFAVITAGIGTLAATNYAFTRFVDGTLTIGAISALNTSEVTALIGSQLANLTGPQVGSFTASQLQVFSPQQLSALSPSQLAGLTNAQLLSLSPDQIAAISPARIASMTPDQLAGLSASQFAGLTTSQLQALSAAQIAAISTAQLGQLSSAQITALTSNAAASLSFQQIAALTPAQIVGVNPVEVASFTATQIGALSIPQLQALSLLQVAAISPTSLSSLTPQQIAGLTSNAAASLSFQQIAALAPTQIVGVDAARVASLTAAEIGSLSDAQLQALSLLQIAAIAPDHFSALSPAQIMALSITQVINLTPDQLRGFSPAQVASLSAAELAYFDARQLAAIGIVPKTEAPVAQAPVPTPVAAPSVEVPVPPAIATSNQLPLNFETPNAPVEQVAVSAASTTSTVSTASEADANDARNKFQAAIPVMTAVAGANATAAVPAAAPTPITAAPVTTTVSTAVTATTTATPTAPAAGVAQSLPSVTLTVAAPQTGVLAITILSNAEPKPTTAGVAFEQDGNSVTLRTASAPPTPPASDKLTFNDNLTTFMVSSASGGLIEFKASLVNRRLVILAQSTAARQIARAEMNVVLAAAITSLGAENRVMLANLDGVVLDLR